MKRRANYSGNRKSLLVFILCFTFTVRSSTCCTERSRDTANSFSATISPRNVPPTQRVKWTEEGEERRMKLKGRPTNQVFVSFLPSCVGRHLTESPRPTTDLKSISSFRISTVFVFLQIRSESTCHDGCWFWLSRGIMRMTVDCRIQEQRRGTGTEGCDRDQLNVRLCFWCRENII